MDSLYILRGVITTSDNDYFIALNTVKVTNKSKEAANYLSRAAASKAASYLCDSGDPYVVCLSYYDQSKNQMHDQLFVLFLETDDGKMYFASASPSGIMMTDDLSEAAHYLSEETADAACKVLADFDETFSYETNGFWGEE